MMRFKILTRLLRFAGLIFSILFLVACAHLQTVKDEQVNESSQNQPLHQLFDDEWHARTLRSPDSATRDGIDGYADKLEDASPSAQHTKLLQTEAFLKRLHQIDYSSLNEEDQINYKIFEEQLVYSIRQIKFKAYQIPFLSDYGFHTQIAQLRTGQKFASQSDYENYIRKLRAIPRFFEQHKANMRAGMKRGFTMPKVVMNGFTDVIKSQLDVPLDKNSFWKPFIDMPSTFAEDTKIALRDEAKSVIAKQLRAAYLDLFNFFDKEYIPNSRDTIGAYDLPDGKAYYQAQIEHYTTLQLTPQEIHQIGLREVARIRHEMEAIIEKTGFKGSFKEFLSYLRTEPKFYAKSAKALIMEASYLAKKIDGQLPKFFGRLPRQPYTVEPVPASIAPKYTTGRYVGAPIESTRPGIYWVNTYALDKRPLYVLPSLTLHEAVPGHHLQTALNQELGQLPEFRRNSYISAFGEGWALYCENLGQEMGLYEDPYADFGRLTYEMWRAARLVIDTGIHAMGWSRERAIKLLEENSALSTHNIRTEVDRYISWPGQALSYKLGEIKIRQLRKKAEQQLGQQFDIRSFHDAVLANGSIPLNVLELKIEEFIKKEAGQNN